MTATVDPATGAFVAPGVPLDPAGSGEQTLTATATDALGHTGSSSVAVTLDPEGPALVLSEPADLGRYNAASAGPITVRGEAWAAPGTAVSVNGVDLDPAILAWEAPGADGRRHVAFTTSVNLPVGEGGFGIIARATDLQGRWAQDRRLLYRDTQAPRVVEMVPVDGATGVDGNGLLLVLFSEPVRQASLDAANGLVLTRVSTGQAVVGSKTVAGQAVGFAPGAALAAGESYVLRAGAGVVDLAGNPLATPAEVRFTVATPSTGGAPVLDALPAVLCDDEIAVSGQAAPGATLKVRDGDLTFTGFADGTGHFSVAVPAAGSGYHLLAVWALDAVTGARSPEATAVVRIDCRAPSVTEARFDRATGVLRIVFSEAMAPATLTVGGADASIRLLDAEVPGVYQGGALSQPDPNVAQIQLDAAANAWWRDRPVRLQVAPPAADLEGNALAAVYERVFFPGGSDLSGGFLFGEVYDDTTGRPLPGAAARLFASGQTAAPVTAAVTDGRGRFVLAGEVPAGRYVLEVAGEGTTKVYRRLSLRPSEGVVPFDSRVTPLAAPAGSLTPAAGGSVVSSGLTFAADPAALPGVAPVEVRLTPRSGQGLPDFLPLGWTPAAAAEIHLEQEGAALPEQGLWTVGAARLELPLPAWAATSHLAGELVAARYEAATGRWLALPVPELVAGGVRISVAGPGTVVVVVADTEAVTSEGEPLAGVERPAEVPALTASLSLNPPVVGPTGKSQARVVARSADGAAAWPSGLAVQAYLEERLVLSGGGEVLEAPFSADLVLYHPELTDAERNGAAAGAAGALEFTVSPSPRAAQVLLEVGWENIRLFPFPEDVERGPVVGPDGGTIDTPAGLELTIPEGALGSKVPVAATLLSATELAALPAVAGYDTLAAVRLDFSGATLARPATLALPTPAGTPADSAAAPRVVVAELLEAPVDGRGALAQVVARTRREGSGAAERLVAAPELAGLLPLDGIVREGLYLVLAAHQPLGFATGFVKSGNGTGIGFSRVTAEGLGSGDLSRLTGRYAIPVPAGADRHLTALHPTLDERGTGVIPALAAAQVASLDLVVEPVPPRIVSKTPQEGATNQPLATAVTILFSEPLAPATATSSTLTLELLDGEGQASGVFVDGAVSLVDTLRVVFAPSRPLLPGRRFRAHFSGGVADAGGTLYAGPPQSWSFSTSSVTVPGGQVHSEKFHIRVPVNGIAQIYGDPGALPGSLSGQTPWAVSPEIEGPVADPLRETFQAKADGSFTGTVGHPPAFKVELGSKVWVKVFDPTGTLAAQFQVGPFTTPDGLGFVAPAGEAVTFRSAEGLVVDVPAAAFDKATLVRVRMLAPGAVGVATPQGLGLGAYIDVDFDGEAKETLRVAVPAPAGIADDAQVFIGKPVDLAWGRRIQFLSAGGVLERDGQRYLSNDPSLQPEPEPGAAKRGVVRATGRTCRNSRQEGLNRCFLQSLLVEFTLRSTAAFYYEQGVEWSILAGLAAPFPMMLGIAQEAITNFLADSWVYMPRPHDWNGGFVLPVLSGEPLELARRDTATGWVLARQTYDPVPASDGLINVGFLGGGEPTRPLLIDARPFQLYRLPAPVDGETSRLSLEMEMRADAAGLVTVEPMAGFPVPAGTSVSVYDLSPTSPPPAEEGEPEPQPAPPIAGSLVSVCNPDASWSSTPLAGSDDLLVVVSPGGLDATSLTQFELQFDRSLKDVTGRPPEEVAHLVDLGPLEDGCGTTTASGYPRNLPFVIQQTEQASRLIILPATTLAAGHRFRLELLPAALVVDDPSASAELSYWETAPTKFEFATREVPGEPISGLPGGSPAFGTTSVARDMLKLGNLLVVASEAGDLVAFDVSRTSDEEGIRRYALKNKGVQSATRALATDGHNRIFYSGLFGNTWGIKAIRLEDVREASVPCVNTPSWATGLPCFEGVEGSVRVAYALGSTAGTTASEWLALGTLPEATPMKLAVLTQDEKGKTLELTDFVDVYGHNIAGLGALTPDAEGIYTFDIDVRSTLSRGQAGQIEPSLPPGTTPEPGVAEWRTRVCNGEEDYDRYQRVTVDNLTTGQSWSLDVENPWPSDGGGGNGTALVPSIRARRGDQLRVRYNLRALGHVALLGSGITVVDLNRFYRLLQPYQTAGSGQCGRRLGKFEGQQLEFPACAPPGLEFDGIAMTPSVVTHSTTGCGDVPCRGEGFIDIYSPLSRVGALHARSTASAPGGVENGLAGIVDGPEAFQFADLAACIQQVDNQFVMLRDVALANDALWLFRGVHGEIGGTFEEPPSDFTPRLIQSDLLFLSLGSPGIYVFDVSSRSLVLSPMGGPALVGRLSVPGHSAFRLQVDPVRGLLFAGGTDATTGGPVIDVWDISGINGAPGLDGAPAPRATLHAPWATNQLGVDAAGTGLLYTWGTEDGPVVVPFDRPQFLFSGLYRPEEVDQEKGISGVQQATSRFLPLGVPLETSLDAEEDNHLANERKATAAFKLRVALPGSLGPELTAKVQSLRLLPGDKSLGQEDVGASVAPPGGPGWPENEAVVRLRRVGLGSEDATSGSLHDEAGPLGSAYQLYESVETVLLEADPRARSGYRRQDAPGNDTADEKAQCRRCEWPGYLPDPMSNGPALDNVKEILAGRYVRAFLFVSDEEGIDPATRTATEAAIDFFEERGENYPLPAGWAEIAGPADEVPSPLQVSLAEPAQSPALWSPGEAGVGVALPGGELLLTATDHAVNGRAIPFSLDRSYRSGLLGYGPLGSAGWSAGLFSHLRELPVTGEVEYHDGMGHVWRFFPRTLPDAPEGYENDDAGSYYAPQGVYLRLQKLSGGQGWRLIGREHGVALYDGLGRMTEISDRHYRGGTAGSDRGNRMQLRYDPFGQLVTVVDDLGRQYQFEYFEDPRPEDDGGDGGRYGLLKSVTDFVDRSVEYEYDEDRRLLKVKLPEVTNPVDDYAEFSYTGSTRPTLEYRYDPDEGVTAADDTTGALLHGKFAKLRLADYRLPDFLGGTSGVPRARFAYEENTGRVLRVGFPTPGNQNSGTSSVEWKLTPGTSSPNTYPPGRITVREPWGHEVELTLTKGRITARREELMVYRPPAAPGHEQLTTNYTFTDDGRLLSEDRPDGSRSSQCFADGEGGTGCESGASSQDRLAKPNVVQTLTTALTQEAKGSADYTTTGTGADYEEDNQLSQVTDGEGRPIDLPVPQALQSAATRFAAENVSARFSFDRFGRVKQTFGGGSGAAEMRLEYGDDAHGERGAGLARRIERGSGESAFWSQIDYDKFYNPERVGTSQGTTTLTKYDSKDRPVRIVSGLTSDGRFAQVGAAECGEGDGARTEKAYDAAGHLVRERRLQDYIDPADGATKCRWVETRYTYNAREQLVSLEETHLASAAAPGQVTAAPQAVAVYEYDEHGRLDSERTRAVSRPDLVTAYTYDDAGRTSATRTGDEGLRQVGYDRVSRVVFSSDGDQGVWQARYDAWGKLFQEEKATGVVVRRRFDKAGNLIEETTFDADPLTTPSAKVLADVKTHFTSFGVMDRTAKALTEPAGSNPPEILVTEQVFDDSGRVTEVWSGPPLVSDATRVDREKARREKTVEYEPSGGRVRFERFGGDDATAPLHAVRYDYNPDNDATWPDAVTLLESVPGQTDLVATQTVAYRRDAFGRPIEESHSDGSLTLTTYDRGGDAIRARTGAGDEMSVSYDGRGLPVKVVRPNGRGFTLYAYDLDGSMLREATRTASAELWETVYGYDATGRVANVAYADGTTETSTYNSDSTLATLRTRDGLLLTHDYDPANRLRSVTPTPAGGASPTLLDVGDRYGYDKLSRPTLLEKGRPGTAGYDPALAVRYPTYDLASRPASEVVGSRAPLSWRYDTWSRPVEMTLPAGPGRGVSGAFQGFTRRFDTIDQLVDVSGLGAVGLSATPLGAQWSWGGAGRIYGVTTKGALRTAARYGYHGGAGQQVPGYSPDAASKWELGTLIWGSAGSASPTSAPQTPWAAFGFGWRGNEGTPSDGAKLGRQVLQLTGASADLFSGMGWAYGYDGGVRLSFAAAGEGDLKGQPPAGSDADTFRFDYGTGDELARIVREATGQISELQTGDYGRIVSREGAPFTYDGVGRRLEDDRFVYRWDWRGQLASVTVKDTWPDADGDGQPEVTPWARHQVRYDYDAAGRMTHRWLSGKLPEGSTDDAQRPFIEKRVFVWERDGLAAEAAYGNAEETIFRWRKTYVPGPGGLDDAVQVVVEDAAAGTVRTYTLLRDEMGTVTGLVAEDEGSDPAEPPVPVRYRYTPYGEAHAESGPELLRARFDADANQVVAGGATIAQNVADGSAGGALVLDWTLGLDRATLPENLKIERLTPGLGWLPLPAGEAVVGVAPEGGVSAGGGGPPARLLVLARNGWPRGASYRVRLTSGLEDDLGRRFGRSESLEWRVPEAPATGTVAAVLFDKRIYVSYETWEAATNTVDNRFPGGQTALFQGLWTDPVTGVAYARARWYDARNAAWLSEDPLADTDSPNLYAFGGGQPNMSTDPRGESATVVGTVVGGLLGAAYAGYRSARYGEELNWNYVGQGALAGAAVGFGIDTMGAGSGLSVWVLSGIGIGAGLGGAAASVSSGGDWGEFGKGSLKGGILGAIGGATGYGIGSAGLSGGWAFAGSVAADTYAGVAVDYAFGDCQELSSCVASNLTGSVIGNGVGLALSKGLSFLGKQLASHADEVVEDVARAADGTGSLSSRGVKPAAGERSLTREQWRQQYRQERIASGRPSSWTKARSDYYKVLGEAELQTPSGRFSRTNIMRMLEGDAPMMTVEVQVRRTGLVQTRDVPLELHHRAIPQRSGSRLAHQAWNLELVTPWAHEGMDSFRHTGYDLLRVITGVNGY
ncbi:MAG TPA: Ig-like domain-containing protein [Thermoanaerobaculia bacterium]|nr:Ig-like domain-containing protein [Thermoanaerobaculia bacterium]